MKCQQDELYRAEERVHLALDLPSLKEKDAQALVDQWRELPWWRERFPRVVHVQVVKRRSSGDGSCGGLVDSPFADRLEEPQFGIVEMAPVHMDRLYLAHEVCHVLAEARYGNGSHHPGFARHYLELVYLTLGSDVYAQLRDSFEAGGVDHKGWD